MYLPGRLVFISQAKLILKETNFQFNIFVDKKNVTKRKWNNCGLKIVQDDENNSELLDNVIKENSYKLSKNMKKEQQKNVKDKKEETKETLSTSDSVVKQEKGYSEMFVSGQGHLSQPQKDKEKPEIRPRQRTKKRKLLNRSPIRKFRSMEINPDVFIEEKLKQKYEELNQLMSQNRVSDPKIHVTRQHYHQMQVLRDQYVNVSHGLPPSGVLIPRSLPGKTRPHSATLPLRKTRRPWSGNSYSTTNTLFISYTILKKRTVNPGSWLITLVKTVNLGGWLITLIRTFNPNGWFLTLIRTVNPGGSLITLIRTVNPGGWLITLIRTVNPGGWLITLIKTVNKGGWLITLIKTVNPGGWLITLIRTVNPNGWLITLIKTVNPGGWLITLIRTNNTNGWLITLIKTVNPGGWLITLIRTNNTNGWLITPIMTVNPGGWLITLIRTVYSGGWLITLIRTFNPGGWLGLLTQVAENSMNSKLIVEQNIKTVVKEFVVTLGVEGGWCSQKCLFKNEKFKEKK
ncbi:hypothetical protein KUTeg_023612 [Tegillarca granosa]|uniref:Uncharacterized protein n=1 Tax=Tegillarca granosa TaxID=220873 RepID=A0ABQ9E6Q3_TEGGR|nr:hypothetical protein KUTeg_023612 [Tegillarca granosa]